jgi:ABC-type multidrug transport system fused ATPase/permease subunit
MSWEDRFIEKVMGIRNKEVKLMRNQQLLSAGLSSVYSSLPIAMIVVVLGLYAKMGGEITASMAFTTITLMDMVRGPLIQITSILNAVLVDGKTAVDRLSKFLNTDDMDNYVIYGEPGAGKPAVKFTDVTLQHAHPEESIWDPDAKRGSLVKAVYTVIVPKWVRACLGRCASALCCCCPKRCRKTAPVETADKPEATSRGPCLENLNLEVPPGSLCCIVGRVGSGKSSLVLSLLGEIEKPNGIIQMNGRLSYAAQSAAVINDTVRNNILYGNEYNAARYKQVIKVCCLKEDLKSLPAGDASQIGEKGISLSGGQRQRIGLARACYQDSDVYLLDDPLSAVDAHTGKTIFDKCIMGMLKHKTVILPIHNLGFLDQADMIVALKDNRIVEKGSYNKLMRNNDEFAKMMQEFAAATARPVISGLVMRSLIWPWEQRSNCGAR